MAAVAREDGHDKISTLNTTEEPPPRRPDDTRNLRSTYYWGTYPDTTPDPVSERQKPSSVGKRKREVRPYSSLTRRQPGGWE